MEQGGKVDPKEELREMLTYRRPAGSKTERRFIRRFLRPLGITQDKAGNIIKRIGDAPVMWSSHTDTVHKSGGRQTIIERDGWIKAVNSSCLGADDTAGVWLMVQMIRRNVPGLYVFHRAEEIGGYGSLHIAETNKELLAGIDMAIALDRRGENSIITHQWGGRCCSDAFARALGRALDLGMRPDDTGSFTDTANYMELVPECTNISVGYYNQHSRDEMLFPEFLERLLEALCELDVYKLPVERDPALQYQDEYRWPDAYDTSGVPYSSSLTSGEGSHNFYGLSHYEALRDVVKYHPDLVVDLLDSFGITAQDVLEHGGFSSDDIHSSVGGSRRAA